MKELQQVDANGGSSSAFFNCWHTVENYPFSQNLSEIETIPQVKLLLRFSK